MVRKTQSGKSPSKKRKSDPDNSGSSSTSSSNRHHLTFTSYQQQQETSVHKRNLCIVSFPLIFLFNVLRSLLYQIFVILRFIYCSSSALFFNNNKVNRLKDTEGFNNGNGDLTEDTCVVQDVQEMSNNVVVGRVSCGPGPGDPLLAKQKHHHRRAFEYISKALKIDEENEGTNARNRINFLKKRLNP